MDWFNLLCAMGITQQLGLATAIMNIVVIVLLIITMKKWFTQKRFQLQFSILLISILLLLPVIIFENVLFLDIEYSIFQFSYSLTFMRLVFTFGILAYLIYNLHLLTIEDMPSLPLSILGIITGFTIGAMAVSAQIDPNRDGTPIFYDPIEGGIYFILGLMIFNIIGIFGFFYSMYGKEWVIKVRKVSAIDLFAIFNFFISPIIIYSSRIFGITVFPVNFIFLNTEIAFSLHLLIYLVNDKKSGYPIRADLISLSILDLTTETVMAGFSVHENEEDNKLRGMAILAIDSVVNQVIHSNMGSDVYYGNYGDAMIIRKGDYQIVGQFNGGRGKIGKYNLRLFLKVFISEHQEKDFSFLELVLRIFHDLLHKKIEVQEEQMFFMDKLKNVSK